MEKTQQQVTITKSLIINQSALFINDKCQRSTLSVQKKRNIAHRELQCQCGKSPQKQILDREG